MSSSDASRISELSEEELRRRIGEIGRPALVTAEDLRFGLPGGQRRAWDEANPEALQAAMELESEALRRTHEALGRLEEWRSQSRLARAGVPRRFLEVGPLLRTTEALKATAEWRRSEDWALCLLGGVGTGKTLAACRALASWGGTVAFFPAAEASLAPLYGPAAADLRTKMKTAGMLVVDDLGAELLSDAWRALFDSLVNERYGWRRALLLTSNLSLEDFKARYGERVVDRLRDGGRIVSVGEGSLRGAK
jgi:DNA replication protein DnaC